MIVPISSVHHRYSDLSAAINPFPNDKFQTLPNSEFADDSFKVDENGEKFSERVENAAGKG